ncbi:MAG TPA: helix-turn-helix transcriptional regulator [Microbacterium sp.]|nr:helix-turn-helix transcriptional regulator [Microbacterium sp.]
MPTGAQPLPSRLSQEVGRILGEAVAERSATQADIAIAAGMSPAQLSRALSGKKVFTIDQLDSVCSVLDVDLIDVITRADIASRDRIRPVLAGELIQGRFNVPDTEDTDDDFETPDLETLDFAAKRGTRKADAAPWAE